MRLLVFSALLGLGRCFYPSEPKNEGNRILQTYIFNKDEYLRQIWPHARVSYANPFLQYQHPLSYRFYHYNNPIGPYDTLARQQSPLPNEISINNNAAFVQNYPTVLTAQGKVFRDSTPTLVGEKYLGPEMPIILNDAPKVPNNIRYLQALLPMNKNTPDMTGLYYDLIQQRRKGSPTVSTAPQNVQIGYRKINKNTPNKGFVQPINNLNKGDTRVGNLPDLQYIIRSIYDDVYIPDDTEIIVNYAIELMLRENYMRPNVIQVINAARNIDFSKLDEIDETKLVKLSNQDIAYLKQYMIKVFNAYGLTNNTFKLLEYIYLIEGIPKNEIRLILKILSEDGAIQNFDADELEQLRHHLLRIYEDYSDSPNILAFLGNILETKLIPTDNNNAPDIDIDYGNNNIQNEGQEIIDFVSRLMISENNISTDIIKVLNSAQNIDFSNIEKLAEMRLDQISNEDLFRLKKYLVQVFNLYGLTTYTFKLSEYIYILEGRPIIESNLMWRILADNIALKKLSKEELNLIHEHLLQVYRDYSESPYILAFLKNILDNQFKFLEKDKSDDVELDDYDIINDEPNTDMQNIHERLSQTYNNNPNVLNILKTINDIYGYEGNDVILPVIDQSDLQSLTNLESDDLDLLVKYILQIISQRGDNIYLNKLLSYINWLQSSRNMDGSVTNFNTTEEQVDLSPLYQYVLEYNNSASDLFHGNRIIVILNHLSQLRLPLTTLYSIETLGYGDLIMLRNFLLHNQSDLSPAILDFINKFDQAIQKQEAKVILEGDQLVEIMPDDLEVLKQYMTRNRKAVPDYYLHEILQLIEQAQNRKDENGFETLKYFDLMQIYKYLLQTQGGDIDNPVLIKVQEYVNENNHDINVRKDSNYKKPDVNIPEKYNIIHDNEINLEEFYKFLLNCVIDNTNPVLLQLLSYFNETLVMPNGKLKIKKLSVNSTNPEENISQNDLEKLLPYLVNLTDNSETEGNNYLYEGLLKYFQSKISEKDYDVMKNPLYVIPIDALYRINLYLQAFLQEYGDSEYASQIILQINEVFKAQLKDNNSLTINDLNLKRDDLQILLEYLTKYVNETNPNSDFIKLMEYIIKSENDIKNQSDNKKNQERIRLFLIKLINSDDVTLAVKDILQFLLINKNEDDPYSVISQLKESHMLDKLSYNEIQELLTYLLDIKTTYGPNKLLGTLIDIILRVQKEENKVNNDHFIMPTDIQIPELGEKNKDDLIIPGKSVNQINTYLIQLLDLYGEDEDVMQILYKINHIKDNSDMNNNLKELITSANNTDVVINIDDLKSVIDYLINLINRHDIKQDLIKILRIIFNFDRPPIDQKVYISWRNDTHVKVALDQKNFDQIRQHIDTIDTNYKLHTYQLNILPILYPEQKISFTKEKNNTKPNIIYTLVITHGQLGPLTKYILELIREYGVVPELINVLIFICDIYGDKMIIDGHKQNPPTDFVISDEIRVLFQEGVLQEIQNMNTDSLKNLYMQLVQTLFEFTNIEDNANKILVIDALLDMYHKEMTTVNKYILLKLLGYLKNNEEINYEALWQPDFILVLLDTSTSTNPPDSLNQIARNGSENHVITQPYDYKNDVQGSLNKLIKEMYQPVEPNDKNNTVLTNFTIHKITIDDGRPLPNVNVDKNHEPSDTKEYNKNVMDNNTINIISTSETYGETLPNIKAENLKKSTIDNGKNHLTDYSVYKISKDGIRERLLPNIEAEGILEPIDINEKNKDILPGYKIEDNNDNGFGEHTLLDVDVENPNHSKEQNHNIVTEYTIDDINKSGIRRPVEHNIKIIKALKPIHINDENRNVVVNYTVYKISDDGIRGRTISNTKPIDTTNNKNISVPASNINAEKNSERFDTKEQNKNIIGNNIIAQINNDGFRRRIQPNIEPIETKNESILTEYTIYENTTDDGIDEQAQSNVNIGENHEPIQTKEHNYNITGNNTISINSEDGTHKQTEPKIKVEKKLKAINSNGINNNIVAKYAIDEINDDGISTRIKPNIKPIDTKENKYVLANYTSYPNTADDVVSGQILYNVNIEKNQDRINTKENNKNIIGNNTIYVINKNKTDEQMQPNIKVEKLEQSFDTTNANDKNKGNYTVQDLSENKILGRTKPYIEAEKILEPTDINEKNKDMEVSYKIADGDGFKKSAIPDINVENTLNRTQMKDQNHNIITAYTVNEISDTENRSLTESSVNPIDGNEKNKNIGANYTTSENTTDNRIPGRIQSNINIENTHERIDTEENNKNIIGNNTIYVISKDKINGQTQSNIKVENLNQPFDTTNQNDKILVANYTIYEINEDDNQSRIQSHINPDDSNGNNKTTFANYTIYDNTIDHGVRGRTQSNITIETTQERIDTEENKNIIGNNTIYVISKNEHQEQTQPDIEIEKSFDTRNESEKIIMANNTVYPINQVAVRRRILSHNMPIDTNKNILVNTYEKAGDDGMLEQTQSSINLEKQYDGIETREHNKNITGNNTTYVSDKDKINGQTQSNITVEKSNDTIDISGEDKKVTNKNSEQTPPNLKEMSCEQANMTFNLILTQLQQASSSNNQQIDLSLEEFLQAYEILKKFKNKLTSESPNGKVSSDVLVRELEQRLLADNIDTCQYQPNAILNTIISDLVKALREAIQYMKVSGYHIDRIKAIVVSLVNRLMPDINAIAVKDCKTQTPKSITSILFSNLYSNKDLKHDEIQFATGYTLKGNSDEDFLHTLSMQKLLQEIAKYRNL